MYKQTGGPLPTYAAISFACVATPRFSLKALRTRSSTPFARLPFGLIGESLDWWTIAAAVLLFASAMLLWVRRFGLVDLALRPIAEIVHDIDLKDAKFTRPEGAGIDRLIAGIAMGNKQDEGRLAQGTTVFDGLYEYFRRKKP